MFVDTAHMYYICHIPFVLGSTVFYSCAYTGISHLLVGASRIISVFLLVCTPTCILNVATFPFVNQTMHWQS